MLPRDVRRREAARFGTAGGGWVAAEFWLRLGCGWRLDSRRFAEFLELLGSEEDVGRVAKTAVVMDLVRRGRISRAQAAELLGLALWDLPGLLAQYRIPWFDYSPDDLERDLEALHAAGPREA